VNIFSSKKCDNENIRKRAVFAGVLMKKARLALQAFSGKTRISSIMIFDFTVDVKYFFSCA
jgi:hypothetical protein